MAASAKSPFQGSTTMTIGLILLFGVGPINDLGNIVTLINECSTVIFDLVSVRRPRAKTHEDDASGVAQPEIHSTLEIYSDRRTHLHVGNHIIGLEHS
jgi:hypothetical protein